MRGFRPVVVILLGLWLGAIEVSVTPFFPLPWNAYLPILSAVVLLIAIGKPGAALILALAGGAYLDLFQTGSSFFAIGRFTAVTFVLSALSKNVFTNRSLYASVALAVIARFLERAWVFIAGILHSLMFHVPLPPQTWSFTLLSVAWDVLVVVLGFFGIVFFTRRLLVIPGSKT